MYNKRQELILDFIKDNPLCKRDDIEKFLLQYGQDVTKMTITRDLKLLIGDGLVEKSGSAKATVYKALQRLNVLVTCNRENIFKPKIGKTQGMAFRIIPPKNAKSRI